MNETKTNFFRNNKLKNEYCIPNCGKELDNEHLTWWSKLNTENEYKYIQLLNGPLNEKIETFKQIKPESRKEKIVIPCDPVLSVDPINACLAWDKYR